MPGGVLRFLDHIKNEDSPGPRIGSHHAFFSDDQEPCPVTDIADLIRDSYEVTGPVPPPPMELAGEMDVREGSGLLLCALWTEGRLSGPWSPCRSLGTSLWSRLSACVVGTGSGFSKATRTPQSRMW